MNPRFSSCILYTTALFSLAIAPNAFGQAQAAAEKVGQRPYEMEWANRHQDEYPPLVDFENDLEWKVEGNAANGTLARSREQQIWGKFVGKFVYRGSGEAPQLRVLLAKPIAITASFNAVTCWVYGNKAASSPQPSIGVLFADKARQEVEVPFRNVDWNEWFLLYRRLSPELVARLGPGATFKGFTVSGGRNTEDRELFFDNFAVFTEGLTPLKFEPRPQRGIPLFQGQNPGTNTGPGKLDFPTRWQTILPDNLVPNSKNSARVEGKSFIWTYDGADGRLVYRLEPKSGTLSDITAQWQPRKVLGAASTTIQPCVGGGVYLAQGGNAVAAQSAELLDSQWQQDTATLRWRIKNGTQTQEVTYRFRLRDKTMIIDVIAPGGNVAEVRYGQAVGLEKPRLVTNPYYVYTGSRRPAVAVSGSAQSPLFLAGNTDWYLSNATELWANNDVGEEGVTYNGGTRYIPRTDGKRNDCYERLFVTISPRYEETLPNIPNPKSPWMQQTGTRLWRSHGSGNRKSDMAYWEDLHRHGITDMVVVNHETMWRDGEESFTFRTKAAPGKGGDEGEAAYARFMQDKLGYLYGPYNNFTDIAPVNEYWNLDMATRTSDNQFQYSWYRTYAPKPSRAVEYAAKIPPIVQKKFHYSTAYCDVHTAIAPWHRVDYDPRVPGAATFTSVYYAFGEILQLQKAAWNGPVYSEGGAHFFYSGLSDGNYAQDKGADLPNQPWLVDFDLRKMHPLSTNFGMGNMEMFDPRPWPENDVVEQERRRDRFMAATVAFGHTGFLMYGTRYSVRSHYMLQQLQSRYAVSSVAEIRYADASGQLLDTSAAVASDVFKRSQIVTRYQDGTITAVNGHKTEPMTVNAYGKRLVLPPNGYAGWTADGAIDVSSTNVNGHRTDYAATPKYWYLDGRGRFTRFARGAGNGVGICRILGNNRFEVIPFEGAECGFALQADSITALDKAGKELGPAKARVSRGLTYIEPVKDAFSYIVTGGAAPAKVLLSSSRDEVVAGERVTIQGQQTHQYQIPATAKIGERIWHQIENQWIDFTVVAPTIADIALKENQLQLTLTSNLAASTDVILSTSVEGAVSTTKPTPQQTVQLEPARTKIVTIDLGNPVQTGSEKVTIELRAGEARQRFSIALNTASETAALVDFPEKGRAGFAFRGQPESWQLQNSGAGVEPRTVNAGGVSKKATFMHPPWQGGIGYTFAQYSDIKLPTQPAVLRAMVGKQDGSILGDGLIYKVAVVDANNTETVVAQTAVTTHTWKPIEADLSRWAGQTISLKLITDANQDTSGDWGAWAEMSIVSPQTRLLRQLQTVTSG
jgi:hypothetical protein